jgi:polysaccharide export outer membrane protein
MRTIAGLFILVQCLCLSACSGAGSYVWVDSLPPDAADQDYRIHAGDVVSIHVFQQESMSVSRVRVRIDGKIAVPIVGDIQLLGKRPADIKTDLEHRLKSYVITPDVTVTIDEAHATQVSVLGEVVHPGIFVLEATAGVAQALASAGGVTDYADRDRVFVIRGKQRVRLTYEQVLRGTGRAPSFHLEPGDLVVVE